MSAEPAKKYYQTQRKNLKVIWECTDEEAFGIEWLIRLLLQLYSFASPAGPVKCLTNGGSRVKRRKHIEWLSAAKVLFIYLMVHLSQTKHLAVLLFVCYLSLDTLHALCARIFLNDLWSEPESPKRSLVLAFVNYLEIILCFSAIYLSAEQRRAPLERPLFVIHDSLKVAHGPELTPHQAVYFSFITAATVGYGDISPRSEGMQRMVCIQVFISLFLIAVIVSNLLNNVAKMEPVKLETKQQETPGDIPDADAGST